MLLRKGVYHYEYMNECKKFNETLLPEKEEFYCKLDVEDTTDADYMHAKRVCKEFQIKYLGDTLLLLDVFENFRKMCLKVYYLDPINFFQLLD